MPFDYTTGNPDNLAGGLPARMGDIQGPFYDLRTYLNTARYGPALPGAPSIGDTFIWMPSPASLGSLNTPAWLMLWTGANWYFAGGDPARSDVFPTWNFTPGVLGAAALWSGGPSLTVPRNGDWRIEFSSATHRLASTATNARTTVETQLVRNALTGANRLAYHQIALIGPYDGGMLGIDIAAAVSAGDVLRIAQAIPDGALATVVNNAAGGAADGARMWLTPSKIS